MGLRDSPPRLSFAPFIGHLRRRGGAALFFFTLLTLVLTGVHVTVFDRLLHPRAASSGLPPSPSALSVTSEPAIARESFRTVEGVIRRGVGLGASLAEKGLRAGEVESALSALSPLLDFRRLKPGERYTLRLGPEGELRGLTYETGPLEEVVLRRGEEGWEAFAQPTPYETRVETISGSIESSLFESLERLGERDRLTMDFVDIFAWDIDFSHELQPGDAFRIVVEKIYREGRFLTYGRILAAQYRDSDELHQAFYFPHPPEGGDYYTAEGNAVRKTFLKAPVSYSRISSGYSHRRLHPVLKKVRPHLGVDYAAPAGSPVWAAADGVVVEKGYDRGSGRKVVLRHPNGYWSYYLHLARYGKGVRVGSKVRQKQVIGYVGSSGLSTGPHLDYRLKHRGSWRNPLREKFPPGEPLPEGLAERFEGYREWLSGALSTPPDTMVARFSEDSP